MTTPRAAEHRDIEQRFRNIEQKLRDVASRALRREALSVSSGDLSVSDGGSISVTNGGTIDVASGGMVNVGTEGADQLELAGDLATPDGTTAGVALQARTAEAEPRFYLYRRVDTGGADTLTLSSSAGTTRGFVGVQGDRAFMSAEDSTGVASVVVDAAGATIRGEVRTDQVETATTVGTVVGRMPVYDDTGALAGYVPVYDS